MNETNNLPKKYYEAKISDLKDWCLLISIGTLIIIYLWQYSEAVKSFSLVLWYILQILFAASIIYVGIRSIVSTSKLVKVCKDSKLELS